MLEIKFLPDSDRKDRTEAITEGIKEYSEIWDKYGESIVDSIEKITNLKFVETKINAIVYVSTLSSRSFPLSLKAYYDKDIKKGLLVHELCHRLLSGNKVRVNYKDRGDASLEIHKVLDLVLYDIWKDLFKEGFANKMAERESKGYSNEYKKAWVWALSFDEKERQKRFQAIIKNK